MPPLALLAGGLATRMHPLTASQPKAMLEVAGEPFIAHQLRLIRRERIKRVVLCVGYLWERIEAFVATARSSVEVVHCIDGPTLLGTGGAIRKAPPDLAMNFYHVMGHLAGCALHRLWPVSGQAKACSDDGLPQRGQMTKARLVRSRRGLRYDKKPRLPQMQHIDWAYVQSGAFCASPPADLLILSKSPAACPRPESSPALKSVLGFYEIGSIEGPTNDALPVDRIDRHLRAAAEIGHRVARTL